MSEIHALSGAYSVDALDDVERAQFEKHLAGCEACRDEVTSLREASAVLAETTVATASSQLRERVLAEIATVRPLPPVVPATDRSTNVVELRSRRRGWVPGLAAAAAVVVALGAGAVITQPWDDDTSQAPTAAERVLQAKDAETFTNTFPGGASAVVVRSKAMNQAVLVAEDMPTAPDGKTYALWLQHNNVFDPAGVVKIADQPVLLAGDAATATGAGVTVEDESAPPTAPSDKVLALFDFEPA